MERNSICVSQLQDYVKEVKITCINLLVFFYTFLSTIIINKKKQKNMNHSKINCDFVCVCCETCIA